MRRASDACRHDEREQKVSLFIDLGSKREYLYAEPSAQSKKHSELDTIN